MTYGERSVRTGAAQETVAILGAGGTMGFAMEGDGGALPVMAGSGQPDPPIWLQMSTVGEEATEHGDKDVSATYLTGAPEQAV